MAKIIIDAEKRSVSLYIFQELFEYKDLLYFLILRDIKSIYKQTILGFGWGIIRPIAVMGVLTLFFGKLTGMESKLETGTPYAIFSYVALIPWLYFASSLSASSNSLISSAGLLSKVYFPRIIIPLTPILAKLIDFLISFIMLFFLFWYYGINPHINRIIYFPLLVSLMIFTSFGIGLWLSALTIKYRDVQFLIPFIIQLLFFASPVIWPITIIPEKYLTLYALYPMAGVIEGFREALIGNDQMPWHLLKIGCISSLFLFISGLYYFKSKENFFADVI